MHIPDHLTQASAFCGSEQLDLANRELGWTMEWRQIEAGPFEARFTTTARGELHFTSERFSRALHILAEPPPGVVGLVMPIVDFSEATVGGSPLERREIVVFNPGSELDFVSKGNAGAEAIFLPESRFRYMVRSLYPGLDLLEPGAAQVFRVDAGQVHAIRAAIAAVQRGESSSREDNSHLIAAALGSIVAARGSLDPAIGMRTYAKVARAAQEYLEERYETDICVAELAERAGVGVRGLQRAFSTYFNVTPIQYLKTLRLNKARRRLVSADPRRAVVSQVALECGFRHLGRFSVDYRRHFAESPSETLRST